MKKYLLLLILLQQGCTEFPTRQLQEVRVVGHVPQREEGAGITHKITYDHWIYENTSTKERFTNVTKYGEIGEVIKIRR